MNEQPTRRTVVRAAAWSLPVIAAAVAVPLAAASGEPAGCSTRSHLYRPQDHASDPHMGPQNNVAEILITGTAVIVTYRRTVDLQEVNVTKPSGFQRAKVDGRVQPGRQVVIPLVDCEDPTEVQVHGNDAHYRGNGVFN